MPTPEQILVALTADQSAMVRSLLYQAIRDAVDLQQLDFLDTLVDQFEQAEDDEDRPALWESSPEVDGETCHNCRNTTWKHDTETSEDHCAACSQAQ